MNDNNYVLLPQVKIGFIYNNIQTVVPFVLDESLDVYNLLKKLVDYCNELGARSNELQYILKDLVDFLNNKLNDQRDYINNFLEKLHQEWLDYKDSLEGRYDEFTQKVDELFETYKEQIRDEYNTELSNIRTNNETLYNNLKSLLDEKIKELTDYANNIEPNIDSYIDEKDQIIRDLITNFQNEFTEYQKTVNNDLIELGDRLTELINNNSQSVIDTINMWTQQIMQSLNNVNMQNLVNTKLNSYSDEELAELFKNLYGSIITITYMDTNTPPSIGSETPIYHYNPDTGVLTDCTTGGTTPLNKNSIYLFENRVFIPIGEDVLNITDTGKELPNYAGYLGINGEIYTDNNNTNLVVYDDEFNEIVNFPNTTDWIYVDSVNQRYIRYDSTNKSFIIYNNTGILATINTSDYIPNETYTYNGYGIGVIDANNYVIFNYIKPDRMEVTIPDFAEMRQLISYTYVTIDNGEIVKGSQDYLQLNEYLDIYPLLANSNYLIALKYNAQNGLIFSNRFPIYPITFYEGYISLDGRSFNNYNDNIGSIILNNDSFRIFSMHLNMVYEYSDDGNPKLISQNYPEINGYVDGYYKYQGKYISYCNNSSNTDVEKVPYYDLDTRQLIYVNNPVKGQRTLFGAINEKYGWFSKLGSRDPDTLALITKTSSIKLQEIPYQRSDS